jgi:hypothetical protein
MAAANGSSPNDIWEAFHQFDHDSNGYIDFFEFKKMILDWLQLPMPPRRLRELWHQLDTDGSGFVEYEEFMMRVYPDLDLDLPSALKMTPNGAHQKVESPREGEPRLRRCSSTIAKASAAATGVVESRLEALDKRMEKLEQLLEESIQSQVQVIPPLSRAVGDQ